MRAFLMGWALLVVGGMVYFNHRQHQTMMHSMKEDRRLDPRIEALIDEWASTETVFVLTTDESHAAFTKAVHENPGKKVWELGVSIEDRLHELEVPTGNGTTKIVSALIVFSREQAVWNDVSLRTDLPLAVLERVVEDPDVDYILFNPPPGIGKSVSDSIALDPTEIAALYRRLSDG